MPHTNKTSAPIVVDIPALEGRYVDLNGYTVGFETYRADADPAELFRGLPDDRCQCPHWGYVVKGKLTFPFADREEVFEAGDAFYVPPGHLQRAEAGTEYLQFSPAKEMAEVEEQIMKNMQAMGGG